MTLLRGYCRNREYLPGLMLNITGAMAQFERDQINGAIAGGYAIIATICAAHAGSQ